MARERSSSTGASVIGMMIFGFLFFISMILAILFYTRIADERSQREEAQANLQRYIRPAEAPQVQALLGQQGSVVGQLLTEVQRFRGLLTPDEMVTHEDLERRMRQLNIDPAAGALKALTDLQADLRARNALAQQLEEQLAAVNKEKEALAQSASVREQTYQSSIASLESRIAQLDEQNKNYLVRIAELRTELEASLGETQVQFASNLSERDAEIADLEKEIKELRTVLAAAKPPGVLPIDPLRTPDGQILSILSEDNMVTINLGSRDRLMAGLTFEVFSRATGIVVDDERPEVRGKATIEVINVQENSAVARVVNIERGTTLHEGDVIINVVFDRHRVHKFTVFGDFDLDNRGEATLADRRRVEAMITRWGGRLLEDLSYDTDYLVLGEEPMLPDPLEPGVIDPVRIAEHAAQQRKFERYQDLRARAAAMQIPILNQNRFLHLVGYYTR